MLIAKLVGRRSTCNSRPSGAVLVQDKQILATGHRGSRPSESCFSGQFIPFANSKLPTAGLIIFLLRSADIIGKILMRKLEGDYEKLVLAFSDVSYGGVSFF